MKESGLFQISQKLFLIKENKVLILKDKKSKLGDLPGGRMNQNEFFEDWVDSLKREIKEELGKQFQYYVYRKPFLVHKHMVQQENTPCVIIAYLGNYIGGDIHISDEHEFFEWVSIANYNPEKLFTDYMLKIFKIFQNKIKNY